MQKRKLRLQGRISHTTSHKLGMLFHKQIFSKSTSLDQFTHKFTFALSACNKFVWSTVNCMHIVTNNFRFIAWSVGLFIILRVFSEELDLYKTGKKWKANWIELIGKGNWFHIVTMVKLSSTDSHVPKWT